MKKLIKNEIYGSMNSAQMYCSLEKVNIYGYCCMNSNRIPPKTREKKKKKKRKTQTVKRRRAIQTIPMCMGNKKKSSNIN